MHQPPRPTIDERQRRRHQRMFRRSEADLLREREAEDHACLAVVRKALPGRTIDQRVEVRKPTQCFPGDCNG
jgi:hypothetical protein